MNKTQRTAQWSLAAAIEQAKREITEDVIADRVPFDVPDFSTLHDYVDANEYGGMCEDYWPVDADGMPDIDSANALQNAVDAWIKSGALLEARAALAKVSK